VSEFRGVAQSSTGHSQLGLVVETKGKDEISLGKIEVQKIGHAESYFGNNSLEINVRFETQLSGVSIHDIIKEALAAAN
jgi:restriction endonuclease